MKNRKTNILTFALDPSGDNFKIKGYAIKYNELSRINEDGIGKWATKIMPNAFTDSLSKKIDVYLEHDSKQILASTKNKSLTLTEDATGIAFEIFLGNTMLQQDVYKMVQQGLYDSMSFGVEVEESEWVEEQHDGEDVDVRLIKKGEVFEISLVANPAFENTSLMVASNDDQARQDFLDSKKETTNAEIEIKNNLAKAKLRLFELTN